MLLSIKLKNQIKSIQQEGLEFHLKNTKINGRTVGCSGFVKNLETGIVVYIDTEKSCYQPLNKLNLYRIARDLKDYGGFHSKNLWSEDSSLAESIVNLLKKGS